MNNKKIYEIRSAFTPWRVVSAEEFKRLLDINRITWKQHITTSLTLYDFLSRKMRVATGDRFLPVEEWIKEFEENE